MRITTQVVLLVQQVFYKGTTILHCFAMSTLYNLSYSRLLMSSINISPNYSSCSYSFKPHSNFNDYFGYIKIHWIILYLLDITLWFQYLCFLVTMLPFYYFTSGTLQYFHLPCIFYACKVLLGLWVLWFFWRLIKFSFIYLLKNAYAYTVLEYLSPLPQWFATGILIIPDLFRVVDILLI